MRSCRAAALGVALSATVVSAPLAAQSDALDQTATELTLEIPPGSSVDQVQVQVAGRTAEVLSVEAIDPAERPFEVVVFLDSAVSSRVGIQRLARTLQDHVETLTRLGDVEIVVADPEPRTIQPPTRDIAFLEQALDRLSLRATAEDAIRQRRRSFWLRFEEWRRSRSNPATSASRTSNDAATGDTDADGTRDPIELARQALSDEVAMLRVQRDAVLSWLGDRGPATRPRLLFFYSEPLGHDPLDFYLHHLEGVTGARQLTLEVAQLPEADELGEAFAAYGWTLVANGLGGQAAPDNALKYTPSASLPVGFTFRFGKKEEPEEVQLDLMLDEPDVETLTEVARTSGGRVLHTSEGAAEVLAQLASRAEVFYRLPEGRPSTALPLDVRFGGSSAIAPTLTTLGQTPESVVEARLRRALQGDDEYGGLEVESTLAIDPSTLDREPSTLRTAAAVYSGPVRVSIGVGTEEGELRMRHERAQPAASRSELMFHEADLMLPPGTNVAIVLVEDLSSGEWGLSFSDIIDRRLPSADSGEASEAQQAGDRAVRLVPEDPTVRSGRTYFVAETRFDVARVEFLLDGQRVAERNRSPYRARLDLGSRPRFREVAAVAYDADGFELDRDSLLVNEPPESFWLRIVNPRPGRRVGRVEVEASVKLPDSGELERVDFFWGRELEATVTEAPFSAPIFIPVDQPDGFVRVVATLSDGREAEDVVLMNRPGFGAQIGVELVEMFVVVTDRNGIPVRDLERDLFEVTEDGTAQEIETFASAGDLPLTVGLAIDTSSSLFVKMPAVQRAARDFARSLVAERDRAFLVEFGQRPEIVRPTTSNLRSIVDGISGLEPYGTTPVWEAVALSLEQLEGVPGRKALVVFYDGDDEDQDFSHRRALRLARKTQVPIYLMVMNDAAARTEGRSFKTRSFVSRLERMARAGGGRVYYLSTEEELGAVFNSISNELRSHYLLTYYPEHAAGGPQWRPVSVEVKRRGLTARTIEGYGEPYRE